MTDQTHDSGARLDAEDLALAQGLADEQADASELWDEFDAAEAPAGDANAPAAAASDFDEMPSDDDGDGDGDTGDDTADVGATDDDEPAPAAASAPSIWDNAPAELRAEFDKVHADRERLAHRLKSDEGRVAGYQRRYEDLLKAAQPREVKGDRPSPDAALAAIKQDYPEIAAPLEQVLAGIHGDVATLSEAEEGRRKAAETELTEFLDAEEKALKAEHADYSEVLSQNSQRFVAWIDDQPRAVRDAFARNSQNIVDAAEAASVISAFKAHLKPPAAAPASSNGRTQTPLSDRRERQLGSTRTLSGSSRRPTVSGIPEEGDPQELWDAFEAAEKR